MKSFLKSLVAAAVFSGAALAQSQPICQIITRDGTGFAVTSAGARGVVVGDLPSPDDDSWWSVPEVGSQGPITHFETMMSTTIGEGGEVLVGDADGQIWQVSSAGDDQITIQAANLDAYWTDQGTVWATPSSGEDTQKFTLNCIQTVHAE